MRKLLMALALGSSSALAQVADRPVRLVVSGGLQVPTGNFADYHDYGVHADVSMLLGLSGLKLRPEVSYSRFGLKELADLASLNVAGAQGGSSTGVRRDELSDAVTSLLGGFANIELPLSSGRVQPFLLAGVGAVKVQSEETPLTSSFDATRASLNLGAGIRFRMGPISGLVEARFNNVPAGETGAFFKDLRTIPVTFGLVF
jgi:opacity protein-like surface antigen